MWKRIQADNFKQSAELRMSRIEREGSWWVCDEYELQGDKIVAKYSADNEKRWKTYEPLEEFPDLFLKFVRLHKKPNFVDAALEWSHKYGIPGGDIWGVHSERDEMPLAMFLE